MKQPWFPLILSFSSEGVAVGLGLISAGPPLSGAVPKQLSGTLLLCEGRKEPYDEWGHKQGDKVSYEWIIKES